MQGLRAREKTRELRLRTQDMPPRARSSRHRTCRTYNELSHGHGGALTTRECWLILMMSTTSSGSGKNDKSGMWRFFQLPGRFQRHEPSIATRFYWQIAAVGVGAPRIEVAWGTLERRLASSACQIGAALDDWQDGAAGPIAWRRKPAERVPCTQVALALWIRPSVRKQYG